MSPESLSDLEVVALTIYGEARGETVEGQVAVGCVIRNRTKDENYQKTCLAPQQFSCWNEHDPNRVILEELAQKMLAGEVIKDVTFDQCVWIAKGIVFNQVKDNTIRAKNYITKKLYYSQQRPSWAIHAKDIKEIDNHIFFNV